MKVYINIYDSLNGKIVTLCDENLLGRELKDNNFSFRISDFYKGELVDADTAKEILKRLDNISSIHAIGENSLKILIDEKVITKEDLSKVKYIENVPILLIFYVPEILR